MDNVQHLKDRARFVWAQGDYPELAKFLIPAAVDIVEASGIGPGTEVLDVGAGNGNVAITAASKGALVIASDITPELVEKGRRRTADAGLEFGWQEADAENLPFEDNRFDVVTSSFAAIFAPRADVVAKELMRVARPGGTVAMTTWSQAGYVGQSMAMSLKFAPPPEPGIDTPMSWTDPEVVRARFLPLSNSVEIRKGEIRWRFESVRAWLDWGEVVAPPIVVTKTMMPPEAFASMREESGRIAESFNEAKDGSMDVPAEYLLVLARKPE